MTYEYDQGPSRESCVSSSCQQPISTSTAKMATLVYWSLHFAVLPNCPYIDNDCTLISTLSGRSDLRTADTQHASSPETQHVRCLPTYRTPVVSRGTDIDASRLRLHDLGWSSQSATQQTAVSPQRGRSARRSEHVSPLLRDLHWLRVPGRIEFRLAVLARELQRVSDIDSRRRRRQRRCLSRGRIT